MMTAQSWPWYTFQLVGRIPAAAFTPRPGVDAGLMTITRRTVPLVNTAQRKQYSAFVHAVFTSKGSGLRQILPRVADASAKGGVMTWITQQRLSNSSLPRDLTPEQWAEIFAIATRHAAAATPKRSRNGR